MVKFEQNVKISAPVDTVWEILKNPSTWPLWRDWGMPNMGGPLVTAGGLVFIAAATWGSRPPPAVHGHEGLFVGPPDQRPPSSR